jgi:hypothetical protein
LIIGVACVLSLGLAACSALRFVYNQGPQWAYWWLDNYADFHDDQQPRVEEALQQWFAWHRRTQLADYAGLLDRARTEVNQPATPAQVCGWWDVALKRRDEAVEAAIPAITALAPMLKLDQLAHIDKKMVKANNELREEYLQDDPQDRQKAAVKRTIERIETLYGRLDKPQREYVARMVGKSPWKPERWLADREQSSREALATLRAITRPDLAADQVPALVRTWAARALKTAPLDEATQRYEDEVKDYNCKFIAEMHNLTNATQRKHAVEKIQGWRQDLMSLAGPAFSQNGAAR